MEQIKDYFKRIYGMDSLSVCLLILTLLLMLVGNFLDDTKQLYVTILAYLPLLICMLRYFSTNRQKRARENDSFLQLVAPLIDTEKKQEEHSVGEESQAAPKEKAPKNRAKLSKEEKKLFKIFDCPNCRQKIRVPKHKGRIEITCPKCATKFIKKT